MALGIARLDCADMIVATSGIDGLTCPDVFRIYSTGTPPEGGKLEEYYTNGDVAEARFAELTEKVDNGEYKEICLDNETFPIFIDVIAIYPYNSDDPRLPITRDLTESESGEEGEGGAKFDKKQSQMLEKAEEDCKAVRGRGPHRQAA